MNLSKKTKQNLITLAVLAFILLLARTAQLAHSQPVVHAVNREVIMPEATPIPLSPQEREIEDIIKAVFGDKWQEAMMVARCESGLRPEAMNSQSSATGLFQIMASVHGVRRDHLTDPEINTIIAKKLFDASGWGPWLASNACHQLL